MKARVGLPALLVVALFATVALGQVIDPVTHLPITAWQKTGGDPSLVHTAGNSVVLEEAGPAAAEPGAEAPAVAADGTTQAPPGAEDLGSAASGTAAAPEAPATSAETPAADATDAAAATDAAGAAPANATEEAGAAVAPVETARWTYMVEKIKNMQAVCRNITEQWECNSGNQICGWEAHQDPPCVVPESWVKARLIEAAPCPGSLMESWFNCQAANNDKEACATKTGCTWTAWGNYTSLPLPTRKMLAYDPERHPGACQLTDVYKMRASEEWDALSTLAFQISHLDPEVWGSCPTVEELKNLVPLSSRANCSMSRTTESCAIAAPFCVWANVTVDPKATLSPGQKMWPTSACITSCNTTDQATCEKHRSECTWNTTESTCTVGDSDDAVDPDAPPLRPQRPELPPAVAAPNTTGACVTCSAESTIGDAAAALIQMAKNATNGTEEAASSAQHAEGPKVRSGAEGRAAAALTVAAVAVGALLLL